MLELDEEDEEDEYEFIDTLPVTTEGPSVGRITTHFNAKETEEDGKKKEKRYSLDMPIKGFLLLGPLKQYKVFGIFPWSFMIHLMLVIADSYWLLQMNEVYSDISRTQRSVWYEKFLDEDFDRDDIWINRKKEFFTVGDALN
jgi:hypothetical protein